MLFFASQRPRQAATEHRQVLRHSRRHLDLFSLNTKGFVAPHEPHLNLSSTEVSDISQSDY